MARINNKPKEMITGWKTEECFQDVPLIFTKLISEILNAKTSICMEMFIFTIDKVGLMFLNALEDAAKRGVSVKLIVDGIGSPDFNEEVISFYRERKIDIRVYKPKSWFFKNLGKSLLMFNLHKSWETIQKMNSRNHRKVIIVDKKIAWIGSANIDSSYLSWRETMVKVSGKNVDLIVRGFDWIWNCSVGLKKRKFYQNLQKTLVCHSFSWTNKSKKIQN